MGRGDRSRSAIMAPMDRQRDDTAADPGVELGVALLDAGDGRRLERLGRWVVDRPAPMAMEPARWRPGRWSGADLRFDRSRGWSARSGPAPASWPVEVAGLQLELRPAASGGIGLYPEHAANVGWLEERIAEATAALGRAPVVLNLFAHTGLLTLAAARAGASVTHVDAARGTVGWARANAAANELADRPIRWIVDDALAFVEREARRGRRYDGLVIDPPSFGRSGGARFRLRDDLERLLEAVAGVAAPGTFALVTAHTTGLEPSELVALVRASLGPAAPGRTESVALGLRAESGVELRLGWAIRLGGGPTA